MSKDISRVSKIINKELRKLSEDMLAKDMESIYKILPMFYRKMIENNEGTEVAFEDLEGMILAFKLEGMENSKVVCLGEEALVQTMLYSLFKGFFGVGGSFSHIFSNICEGLILEGKSIDSDFVKMQIADLCKVYLKYNDKVLLDDLLRDVRREIKESGGK